MDRNYYNDEMYHFGIKGMKWGIRRFQNADGSLKPAGEKRYLKNIVSDKKPKIRGPVLTDGYEKRRMPGPVLKDGYEKRKRPDEINKELLDKAKRTSIKVKEKISKTNKENSQSTEQTGEKKGLSDKQKKALKVGAAVAGTALAAYGAYKVSKVMKEKSYIKKTEIGKSFVNTKTESWKDLSLDIFQDGSYRIYSTKGGTLFEGADSGKNYEVAERIYNNIRNSNGYDLSVRR